MIATGANRNFEEWREQLSRMMEMARRSQASRHARLDRVCRAAGLGPVNGCVLNNAWVGYQHGRPWHGVDYSKVRLARRLERELFTARRIVDRWYHRTYWEAVCRECRVNQPCAFHAQPHYQLQQGRVAA